MACAMAHAATTVVDDADAWSTLLHEFAAVGLGVEADGEASSCG